MCSSRPRGSSPLPLWPGDDPLWAAWAVTDVSRALAAGLRFRAVDDTVAATLGDAETVPGIGLEPARESECPRSLALALTEWVSRNVDRKCSFGHPTPC